MARLSVTLLGGFQARFDGNVISLPTRKAQALLAYLALTPGQAHPRDKLAALLWGGIRQESARASLRQALFAIRKGVGGAVLVEGATIALRPDAMEVDTDLFTRAVTTGSQDALARGANLYKGDLLAGFVVDEAPFEEWLLSERERLRELALEGLAKLLASQRRSGTTEAATQTALKLLALDPLQEPVHRALMRLYSELGRRGAALRQYQHCVAMLQRELGTEPEPETQQLYQEILRGPAVREGMVAATAPGVEDRSALGGALVGRDAEMTDLRAALGDAVGGAARMVALVGEAGIGKSRLVTAIAAESRAKGVRMMLGRCYENERMLPFAPWIDGLRAIGLRRDDDEIRTLDSVWRAELTRLLPELATPDLPRAGDEPMRLFEAVTRLVEQRAARAPLMLVLEDVHWADESSLRLLAYLRRRLDRARVLTLITVRAEELADATVLRRVLDDLEGQQRLVSMALGPLRRADTIALVHALARTGSDVLVLDRLGEDVWTASEGNPFMVVETVRAVEEGRGAVSGPLALPERVRRVIADRLERLGHHARALSATAAVVGREFDFSVLQRASGLGEVDAAAAVEELVRRRVLHGVGERFDFTHDRIREVAYESMLVPRKKLLHRRVAEAIEALSPDRESQAFTLARHYREADVWDSAVAYFRQAGNYATSRAAYREAVGSLEHALETLRHLPPTREVLESAVDIRMELRTALFPLGEPDRTLAYLREAAPLAEALGDDRRRGRIAAYVCVALRRLGDFEGAVEAGERALSLTSAVDDLSLRIATTLYLGQALWFIGAGRRAIAVLRGNVESLTPDQLRQRHGAPGYPGVFSMTDMCAFLAEHGDFVEARRVGEQGLAVAEELAQPFTAVAAHLATARMYLTGGEFAKAIAGFERARSLCERGDLPVQRISAQAGLGYAYLFEERLVDGLVHLEEAVQHVDRIDGFWRPTVLGWLSEGYLLAGRVEDAARVAERARAIAPPNAPAVRAWMLRLAGEVAAHGKKIDVDRAAEHYREAAALAEVLELRMLHAHCHLGLGRLYRSAGDGRARAELSSALSAFRAMDTVFWSSVAESELRKI